MCARKKLSFNLLLTMLNGIIHLYASANYRAFVCVVFIYFLSSITWLLSQNSPGGLFVLRVSATDEDLGSNAKITYSLEGWCGSDLLLIDSQLIDTLSMG